MAQSRPLFLGMEVHTETSAVASVAQEHGAAVPSLGTLGTRQGDIAQRVRQRQAQAIPLLFVSAAGPCGYGLSRSLTQKGYPCWGVAPSLMPQKSGDRVTTNRRAAVHLARRARAGALPLVSVPNVAAEAIRALPRARAATIRDRQDATCRLQACWRRQDSR